MGFWDSEKSAYLFLTLSIITPHTIVIQDTAYDLFIVVQAPIWQVVFLGGEISYAISPVGFILVFWFWPSLYIAKVTYDVTKNKNLERSYYWNRVVIALLFQLVFGILVPPASGTPQPIVMPITIVGVLALLFRKWIIPELTSPWDEGSETVFSE
jgi:hypothetical protein